MRKEVDKEIIRKQKDFNKIFFFSLIDLLSEYCTVSYWEGFENGSESKLSPELLAGGHGAGRRTDIHLRSKEAEK